ncbi:MAG TPA: SMI1/KNR4 family protein [Pyrinomonadaceae bacterium]|nr:SMI1/KNR4 family protein [Pyrinomonadaceae bacterium]
MTDQGLTEYLELLRSHGWRVELWTGAEAPVLDSSFTRRYPGIPDGYLKFLQRVSRCENGEETVWFLCLNDYNNQSDSEWAWNAMEQIDLEGAEDDARKSEVVEFWNRHLPFMLNVSGEYAYMAFRVTNDRFGSVVEGYDIELTEPTDVAASFDDFVRLHSSAVRGEPGDEFPGGYV